MWSQSLIIEQTQTALPDPSDFSTTIDNPFLPMKPGTTFVYDDKGTHQINYVVVTDTTKVVDGVTCVQVHDYVMTDGVLAEDTIDWMAQDSKGNVWYFGEDSKEYTPGDPHPDRSGSWEAGVDGARPGIIMEANPQKGDVYSEEHASDAHDEARVVSLNESIGVIYGQFGNMLETKNFTPLDPSDVEHKWYAAGIGTVLTADNAGSYEQLSQINVDGHNTDDTLYGYAGKDTVSGYGGNDTLFGLDGRDFIHGGGGNDYAAGGNGGDTLDGGVGHDTLNGGHGKDTLIGGLGNDILTGGNKADHFVFTETDGTAIDTITDYSLAQGDAIVLDGGKSDVAYDSFVSGAWQLTLNDGHIIVLSGVTDANGNGHIVDNLIILDAWGA